MISAEQNEYLCRTGPGTPMGNMFRRYWIPAPVWRVNCRARTAPPVRVTLLSERLHRLPRQRRARSALMDEFCAHRGVSLWFGRNEEGGLRCPYHGWKYARPASASKCRRTGDGRLLPEDQADSLSAARSSGGVRVDLYGAARGSKPPLPEWEWTRRCRRRSSAISPSAGRKQLAAGDGRRHRFEPRLLPAPRRPAIAIRCSRAPRLRNMRATLDARSTSRRSTGGLYIGARRSAEQGFYYWRVTQWMMPCFTHDPALQDEQCAATAMPGCRWTTRTAWPGP